MKGSTRHETGIMDMNFGYDEQLLGLKGQAYPDEVLLGGDAKPEDPCVGLHGIFSERELDNSKLYAKNGSWLSIGTSWHCRRLALQDGELDILKVHMLTTSRMTHIKYEGIKFFLDLDVLTGSSSALGCGHQVHLQS